MSIGSGIAIAGMWLGAAVMAWGDFLIGYLGVACALMGTVGIASINEKEKPQQ
jgi:hypothetical protein